jgi:hypothetical protein
MGSFEKQGEAMLLAVEGQRQIARLIADTVVGWWNNLKQWQSGMPTTLPPTEWRPR